MSKASDFLLQPIFLHLFSGSFHFILMFALSALWVWCKIRFGGGNEGAEQSSRPPRLPYFKQTLHCSLGFSLLTWLFLYRTILIAVLLISDAISTVTGYFFIYVGFLSDEGEDSPLEEPLLKDRLDVVASYSDASIFSSLTFSWVRPLISIGYKKALDVQDIPELASADSGRGVFLKFVCKLKSVNSDGSRITAIKLAKALIFTTWKEVLWTGVCAFVYTVASFVGPYLVDTLVQYLNGRREFKTEGYILVSIYFCAEVVEYFAQRHWNFGLLKIGIRIRAALRGEIVNLISVDAERIQSSVWYWHQPWLFVLQVSLALLILYKNLSYASFAGIAATILVTLVNVPIGHCGEMLQYNLMESKDNRMKATSEILRNMRILKLQAWEMKFLSKITDLRNNESIWLRKHWYILSVVTFIAWIAPVFVSMVTFGACLLMGFPLESGKFSSAIATLKLLQTPILSLPDTLSVMALIKVSLDRIASFLCLNELKPDDASSPNPTLKDINITVSHGMTVAICGTIGSGKSRLLSCILGEVPKLSGTIKFSGTRAYVAQSPWIQGGNIEENILFGMEMDQERYEEVLEACSLKKDLEILSFGDQTVIGEQGINLRMFTWVLGSKTVIYVAHQVEFLPAADLIIVMENGRITRKGKYIDILNTEGVFMELVHAHREAVSASVQKEQGGFGPCCKADNLNKQKGQLSQEEEREKGRVNLSVCWKYITAAYGGALMPFLLLSQILFQLFLIGADYWITLATSVLKDVASPVGHSMLIMIYVAFGIGCALCISASASSDQRAVDLVVPYHLWGFAFTVIRLLAVITVMSQLHGREGNYLELLITLVAIFFPKIINFEHSFKYCFNPKEEQEILFHKPHQMEICEVPLIQHFAETISGSTTIRSFDQSSRFKALNMKLIDGYIHFYGGVATEWLCLHMDLLSFITFAFCLVLLISVPPGAIDPMFIITLCTMENTIISVERMLQYTCIPSEPPLVIEACRPNHGWPTCGEVNIQNLQIWYAQHLPLVLRGIMCIFPGGTGTGIVGRTGSGKSTLMQALFGIVEPIGSQILIDGINISSIGLHDLQSRLSIIPQDSTMFEGTALDKCQLGDEVRKKPVKLDSAVIENGKNWSMGQRQLVCLGRVLLKKSKVLLLDEAIASVDTATDNLIRLTIEQQFPDCTVLTIAHRITSVLDSDMLLLLDNGLVEEYDSPKKLLENKSSSFAKLVAESSTRSSSTTLLFSDI
ncbi:Xenobiotic-transporting ATPase [Bertholletia excelsa]